jgi:hypothetical protein
MAKLITILFPFLMLPFAVAIAEGNNAALVPILEQQEMDRALLDYAFTHRETYLYANTSDFDFYVQLQGQDPGQEFLDSLHIGGHKLKAWSIADAAKNDPKKNYIGSGHNVMWVKVSGFRVKAPDIAQADVDAYCGALCGGQSVVTMQKLGREWAVKSFVMTAIE